MIFFRKFTACIVLALIVPFFSLPHLLAQTVYKCGNTVIPLQEVVSVIASPVPCGSTSTISITVSVTDPGTNASAPGFTLPNTLSLPTGWKFVRYTQIGDDSFGNEQYTVFLTPDPYSAGFASIRTAFNCDNGTVLYGKPVNFTITRGTEEVGVPTFTVGSGLICNGATATFSAALANATSYTWEVTGGLTINGATTAVTNGSVQVTAPASGTVQGQVKVTAATPCGNSSTATYNVWVGKPTGYITGPSELCQMRGVYEVYTPNGSTVDWKAFKDGGAPAPGVIISKNGNVCNAGSSTLGEYYLEAYVDNACGRKVMRIGFTVVPRKNCIQSSANLTVATLEIYPNPTANQLTVEINVENKVANTSFKAELRDKYLQVKKTGKTKDGKINIDTSDLPNGIYFLEVVNERNCIRRQVVINH